LPRTRTTKEDCIARIRVIEGPLLWDRLVDEVMTERELQDELAHRLGGHGMLSHRKIPDCMWHRVKCTYIVVELKSGSVGKALRQLENFAENFPDIHDKVEFYLIEVKGYSRELQRYMRLEPVKGRPGLYRAMRRLKKHVKPWDIKGKDLYVRKA